MLQTTIDEPRLGLGTSRLRRPGDPNERAGDGGNLTDGGGKREALLRIERGHDLRRLVLPDLLVDLLPVGIDVRPRVNEVRRPECRVARQDLRLGQGDAQWRRRYRLPRTGQVRTGSAPPLRGGGQSREPIDSGELDSGGTGRPKRRHARPVVSLPHDPEALTRQDLARHGNEVALGTRLANRRTRSGAKASVARTNPRERPAGTNQARAHALEDPKQLMPQRSPEPGSAR